MSRQILLTDRVQKKKPTKAFIVSLLGGVLILVAGTTRMAVMLFASSSAMPYVIDPVYGMLKGIGAVGGVLSYALGGIEAISGVFVIVGAMMIHHRPAKASSWGNLVLAFSFVSLVGTGGFMIGAVLGIAGGTFAFAQGPQKRYWLPNRLRRGPRSQTKEGRAARLAGEMDGISTGA